MANDGYLVTRSKPANADLSANQYYFVKLLSTGKVDLQTTQGVDCYGVLQTDPSASGAIAVVALRGETKVVAGSALAVGDEVTISTAGKAVVATMGMSVGRVVVAASSGNIASIELYGVPKVLAPMSFGNSVSIANVETIVATKVLVPTSPTFQALSAAGNQDVTLPDVLLSVGRMFVLYSTGAASLVAKNAGGSTIATVTTGKACIVVCDGTSWIKAFSVA